MSIEEKYRLALLQLQQYSDNKYIILEGKEIDIQNELDLLNSKT